MTEAQVEAAVPAPPVQPAPRTRSLAHAFVSPIAIAILVAAAAIDPASSKDRFEPRPVAAFSGLVDQKNRAFDLDRMRGKPWIASFAFTRCSGPCPRLVATLARLGAALPEVRIVTFSVDPEFDSPDVLDAYSKNVKADPERWLFVTGNPKVLETVARESFFVAAQKATDPKIPVGESVSHSTKLFLVDREGRLRGWHDVFDPETGAVDEESFALCRREAAGLAATGWTSPFPLVNAILNASSAVLLVLGLVCIRRGARVAHRNCMLAALAVSGAFLATYTYHHALHGSTPFLGEGWVRPAYLAVLATHVVLAVPLLPLALVTAWLGLKDRLDRHVRLARSTFALWLYVSTTGVAVFILLYELYRP